MRLCWRCCLRGDCSCRTAARLGTGVNDMALMVAAPPVKRAASWRRARSTASLNEVTGFSQLCNSCRAGGKRCCQRVTVIAAQGVRPLAWRSTADSNRDISARKRSAEADTVWPLSVLKVANFVAHSSTLFAGMRISRRANLSSSQVDGGANEPAILMFSAVTTFALQSILPDIRC